MKLIRTKISLGTIIFRENLLKNIRDLLENKLSGWDLYIKSSDGYLKVVKTL